MKIETLVVGNLQTNCYLVTDNLNNCIIIDPGDEADFISTTILENKLTPQAIFLTHGHYDHCLGNFELKLNFNIPIYIHQNDLFLYNKAHLSAKHFSAINIPKMPTINNFIYDKQKLICGCITIQVIHTPGHTPGSCCFLVGNNLFTGDTLFKSGPGDATRKYSSTEDIKRSTNKLHKYITNNKQYKITIFPGHEDFGFTHMLY